MSIADYNFEDTVEVVDTNTGEFQGFAVLSANGNRLIMKQDFPIEEWNSVEAFKQAGIRGYEPMTAKELNTEEKKDNAFNDESNYIEEKFDGTRGIMQFLCSWDVTGSCTGYARVFSRRISKKTQFYVENSDSLPQLKETDSPEFDGTVIDGEMFINGRPFKDVSSTLNCLWDKAIRRQIGKGFITIHAFDIIKYKGVDVRCMPLSRRKEYLYRVVNGVGNPYITEVPYYLCGEFLRRPENGAVIPYETMIKSRGLDVNSFSFSEEVFPALADAKNKGLMTPKAYYEFIVGTGGEGVIIKPINGKYHHKRGWEYSKIKKFFTRDLILLRFDEPTREYTGKFPNDSWQYWEKDNARAGNFAECSAKDLVKKGYTPVTRHYYYKQVGNLVLGVLISKDEYEKISVTKRGEVYNPSVIIGDSSLDTLDKVCYIMEVCECGGFDDEKREWFTEHREELVGSVIEVRANELMRDSGRLRHPRFERMRGDKEWNRCTWKDHIL